MRTVRRVSPLALAFAVALGVSGASAAERPTVTGLTADPWAPANQDPTEIYVLGDARFFNEEPVTVGTDGQFDAERREVGLFGMDVKNLAIWQPEQTIAKLSFSISFWDFQAVAPEAGVWRWTFRVNGTPYQLEAARGGLTLASTLEAGPVAVFMQEGMDAFRLLGPCSEDGSSCPYHSTVEGNLDTNADRLVWQVPIAEAPFAIGATISPHPLGASASFGAGPVRYSDRATQYGSYTISGQRVEVWVQTTGGDPVTSRQAAFLPPPESGQVPFWANLNIGHLDRGPIGPTNEFDVVAQACSGTGCSTVDCTAPPRVGCVRVLL